MTHVFAKHCSWQPAVVVETMGEKLAMVVVIVEMMMVMMMITLKILKMEMKKVVFSEDVLLYKRSNSY